MTPFDFLNAINENKTYNYTDEYNPFTVNRGLSYFPDTILFASEMNKFHGIPKKMQYDFLFHVIPKKKRFSKWAKKEAPSEDVQVIMDYYNYSYNRATEALNIITSEQLEYIKAKLNKGGKA